jgi:hypothetical protein
MLRVRVHDYKKIGPDWCPFLADGRQVHIAAQPSAAEAFLAMPEQEGLLSGPRGTGKTVTSAMTYLQHVGQGYGPSWKGLWLRHSMTGHIEAKALLESITLPIWRDSIKMNINNSTYEWPTGEKLRLGFFGDLSDYQTWIGQSWPWIGWEELTQFADDKFYRQMLSTNRSDYPGLPVMVRATTNPGGPGHAWVQRRFDPPPEPKYGYVLGHRIAPPGEPTRRAIASVLEENQRFLLATPNYKSTIAASAIDAGQLESWTTGSWNIQAGGLLEQAWYASSEHFILDEFPAQCIPPTWQVVPGFDWGESSPSALLWAAISDGTQLTLPNGKRLPFIRGDMIIFSELYTMQENCPNVGTGATIDEIKREAIEMEIAMGLRYQEPSGKWVRSVSRGIADDMIFTPQANRGDAAESLADEFGKPVKIGGVSQRGFFFDEADKSPGSRIRGWATIRSRLLATVPTRERPGLFITRNCKELLRTLQGLPRDPKKPDDCPSRAEDHLPDVVRYLLGKRHGPAFSSYSLNDRRGRALSRRSPFVPSRHLASG